MSERPAERSPEAVADRRRWRLYPFEIVAWGSLAAAVLFLRAHGLRIDWNTVAYTVPPLFRPTAQVLLAGPPLYAVYLLLRRRPLGPYLRRLLRWDWLALWLRLWLTCFVFTYAYFWLKVCVPLVNYRLWDQQLWALDRLLHLGVSPSILLTELFAGSGLIAPLETWYGWWLPTMMFGLSFFCAAPDAGTRRRFMLSSVLIWTLGPWIYMAAPALGPIYVYGQAWDEVAPELPQARAAQAMLWQNYQTVVAGRQGGLKRFNPTRGIAAMPSLHVGGHWLLLLWIRRRARPWLVPAAIGMALTLVGSVVTGWHYAVDGYVGIGIASLAYWAAWRLDPEPAQPQPSPATGEGGSAGGAGGTGRRDHAELTSEDAMSTPVRSPDAADAPSTQAETAGPPAPVLDFLERETYRTGEPTTR